MKSHRLSNMERLDKIIASQGQYSRSEVKKLVKGGRITVNGAVPKAADIKIDPDTAEIAVDGVLFSADEKILETIKGMWTLISEYRNPLGTSQNITGQTLDPLYRYVSNEKVYTVGAYEFADKFNAIYADNGYYQFAVTKASSRTAYQYSTTTKTQKPSLYIYEQYLLDKDDREITINCSSQITTYYTPAINKLSGSSVINKELMNQAKALLSQVTFTDDANGSLKASLTFLVDAAIEELE